MYLCILFVYQTECKNLLKIRDLEEFENKQNIFQIFLWDLTDLNLNKFLVFPPQRNSFPKNFYAHMLLFWYDLCVCSLISRNGNSNWFRSVISFFRTVTFTFHLISPGNRI